MKRLNITIAVAAILMAGTTSYSMAEKSPQKAEQKKEVALQKCPVMGGKVDKKLYVDIDGKRIYVCCKGCIKMLKKNPEKYIDAMEKKGVVFEKVPVKAEK